MAMEVKLPELGEGLEGGAVLDVKVTAGSVVQSGQTLLELEAEKSTVEVPAPAGGRIVSVAVKKGDHLTVGQTICMMETGATEETASKVPTQKPSAAQPRADTAAPAPNATGTAPSHSTETPQRTDAGGRQTAMPAAAPAAATIQAAGPATRQLARELGVDLQQVQGSAKGGRITADDVKAHVRDFGSQPDGTPAATSLPDFGRWGPIERRDLGRIRRKTAEHMIRSWREIPHVTQQDLADITDLEAWRKHPQAAEAKLTVTAFALKASAIALKRFPTFNASLDVAAGQVVLKNYYHVGVAVDTEHGLLVPVLRDVDRKTIIELARELTEVAEQARRGTLSADQMRGGTFTITNLGGLGGAAFSPIINHPEVAILGLARARLQPCVVEGQITPRLILPVCVSYDHRLIDGAAAARFTRFLCDLLEKPALMLMHA